MQEMCRARRIIQCIDFGAGHARRQAFLGFPALVQHFANQFIAEFERPLVRYDDTERPLKARVRSARRGRFDILLAPGQGRRYPNLTDHKRNVEYDVGRVLSVLDDPAFVSSALYTQAEWVVVPFQPRTGSKQPGVTCISSF